MFKVAQRFGLAVIVSLVLGGTLFAGLAQGGQLTSISYPEVVRDAGLKPSVTSISYPEVLRDARLKPPVLSISWPEALRNKI